MKAALFFGSVIGVSVVVAAKDEVGDDFVVWFALAFGFCGRNYFVAYTSEGFNAGRSVWRGML